jgi:hypothetical protein
MNSECKASLRPVSLVLAFLLAVTIATTAQVKSTTNTTEGTPAKEVTVERGEVISVSGNDLFVKMEDGQIRHIPNVPESARVTVDGKELGIHDLAPGMKLQRTITTTTTPRTVTTVQTVTGKVWQVNPPKTVILTLENGENQQFTVPKGQKFKVDGKDTDVFDLKKGMTVSATKITEAPETYVEHQKQLTGSMPPPPTPPPADLPIVIARTDVAQTPAPEVKPEADQSKALPNTASPLPLIGLVGLLLAGASFCLRLVRH